MKPLPKFFKDWLQETLNRLMMKRPAYFKYWTWLSSAAMILCGIPYLLHQFPDVILPDWAHVLSNKVVSWAAIVMFIMSQLTVKNPIVGQTQEGTPVKAADETKMPFTTKVEAIKVADSTPQPPVLEEAQEPKDVPVQSDSDAQGGSGTE